MAIQETLYTLGDGNNYTQQEALEYFGDAEFDDLINSGQLFEVEGEEPPINKERSVWELEGKFYEEADAINYFGQEVFNELVQTNQLKKKDTSEKISSFSGGGSQSGEITPSQSLPPITEQDYFEGGFGDALRGFDAIVPLGIGDFIDDMARAVAGGVNQGIAAENASDLLFAGSMATDEDIASYIEANRNAEKYGASAEMQEYQRTYEEYGGILGVVMGIAKSGATIVPELMLSSFSAMAANSDALAAGGTIIATNAAIGAATAGTAATVAVPVLGTFAGAAAGAITGAAAAVPLAFAAASTAIEMGSTFSELLQGEIKGELTPEKIKAALSNEKTYTSIRNKAVARGIAIGALDMLSGKVGGKVASKILKQGARATGVASRGTTLKALAASSGVEAVGGSIGETAGIAATNIVGDTKGQEFDVSEVLLEGIAEIPGGVKNLISTRFSKAKYKVNGEVVDAATIDNLIATMTLEELTASKIQIDNDYEGRDAAMQDRIVTLSIEEQVRKVIPDITPEAITEVVALQKELQSLEGNKTEVGKERAAEVRKKINEIANQQVVEAGAVEVTDDVVVARLKEINGDDYAYTQEEFDNTKTIIEDENKLKIEEAKDSILIDSIKDFTALEQSEQIRYLEQASEQLISEAEAEGNTDFELTESIQLERANEIYQNTKKNVLKEAADSAVDNAIDLNDAPDETRPKTKELQEIEALEKEINKDEKDFDFKFNSILGGMKDIFIDNPSEMFDLRGKKRDKRAEDSSKKLTKKETKLNELREAEYQKNLTPESEQKAIDLKNKVNETFDATAPSLKALDAAKKNGNKKQIKAAQAEYNKFYAKYEAAVDAAVKHSDAVLRSGSVLEDTNTEQKKVKIRKQVDNAIKSLKTIGKDIKVVVHNDDASYRKAAGEESREQSTRGEYNPKTKTININASKATGNTVAHEVFHALLLNNGLTNKQAKAITDRMLKAVKKTASPELLAKLEKFSSKYESSLQSEESMAELFGLLADEYPNLDAPTKNIVKRWLDKIAKILGVKPFTDAEVIDLLNVVSGKVKSGQEITTKDVEIFDNKKTKKSTNESRKQIIGENADLTALNLSYSLNLAKEIERVQKLSFREKFNEAKKDRDVLEYIKMTPQEVRYMTGWERGVDDKWRYELPDGKLTIRETGKFKLSDVYDSKGLYDAYPQLKDMPVDVDIRRQGAVSAWFIPSSNSIEINAKPDSNVTSLLVHEIQHAVQFIEGFATGGNMRSAFEAYENTVTPEEKRAELELKEEVEVLNDLSTVL